MQFLTLNKNKSVFSLIALNCLITLQLAFFLAIPGWTQTIDDNRLYQANLLLGLGIRQHQTAQFAEAIASLDKALQLFRQNKNAVGEANTLSILGKIYFTLGQYKRAVDCYQQQRNVLLALGDRAGEAKALDDLSNTYIYQGNGNEAKKLHDLAQKIRKDIGNPQGEAAFLGNIGLAYESQGKFPQAIATYQQQLAIAQKSNDVVNINNSFNRLAQVYQSQGQYQQLMQLYQQQLAMATPAAGIAQQNQDRVRVADLLSQLAQVYKSQGQYLQAIEIYQQQLSTIRNLKDSLGEINSLSNLGGTYRQSGQYEQALEMYQQQLAIARNKNEQLQTGVALNNIGLTLLQAGKLSVAEKTLVDVTKVWELIRAKVGNNINYVQEQAATYRIWQQLLIAQNQPEAALEMAERSKSWSIAQLLGMRLSSEPAWAAAKTAPPELNPPTIDQIRQIAKQQNATLIEYSIIPDEGLYVWVVQPSGDVRFRRIDIKSQPTIYPVSSIADVVASIGEAIQIKGKSEASAKANIQTNPLLQLHQLLIKPIADLLPKETASRLIFITQQELSLVPFAALVDISGKYLIEKHTIVTVPAIQVLALTHKQQRGFAKNNALVVGNPSMPRIALFIGQPPQPLAPLVNAEQEAIEIAELLKAKPLIANQATKKTVLQQLKKAQTVHLATYGIIDSIKRQGIPGVIALAPGDGDNGVLSAAEILDLKLKTTLFLISATEVTKSQITSDGISGLSLSLISAGVPSVIMPLWSSPEVPTTFFMTEFYNQLNQTGDKAKALRQAMLKTKEQYPNPRDWAGFMLIGERK
ncbi:TPR repeat-containing protein [Nostoc commune NIES-4072]|uniref:TPR repeat-containing protein n=1 Tax=Nostoc commune NIES-4072 TaxID=2005467 RepID=A0A2R5G4U1_NOSCO|nr:CHAT domain-containing tetratricopeptide repeat protein [Nostoc commune]BBD70151.1 TPR repeat-containing protein [Nostoc commune HK-02]GBG22804.1 TPR repeat-containing protein [Nostoc commune NIES-4072]